MVMLAVNQPHSTTDPKIMVENKLEPGKYRFRLVVFDEAKNESVPADIVVEVRPKLIDPIPDPRVRPDFVFRPEILTRPVAEPVIGPVIKPVVSPGIDPGIFRPGRFTRPGG